MIAVYVPLQSRRRRYERQAERWRAYAKGYYEQNRDAVLERKKRQRVRDRILRELGEE